MFWLSSFLSSSRTERPVDLYCSTDGWTDHVPVAAVDLNDCSIGLAVFSGPVQGEENRIEKRAMVSAREEERTRQ